MHIKKRGYRHELRTDIQKPVRFDKMVEMIESLGTYWLGVVKLPNHRDA